VAKLGEEGNSSRIYQSVFPKPKAEMYVKVEVKNILQIFWPRHALLRHLDWQRA